MKIGEGFKVSVLDTDIFIEILEYLVELDTLNPNMGIKERVLAITEKSGRENLM